MKKALEITMWGKNLKYKDLVWVHDLAITIGIKGITFFKNDGSIKVAAEGEEKNLLFFMKKLKRGRALIPVFSQIENFSVIWHETRNEFEDFSISEPLG